MTFVNGKRFLEPHEYFGKYLVNNGRVIDETHVENEMVAASKWIIEIRGRFYEVAWCDGEYLYVKKTDKRELY